MSLRLCFEDAIKDLTSFSLSGLAAIGIAKLRGFHVTGTSRSEKGRTQILSNGADEFLIDDGDISSRLRGTEKFTKVLELVGTQTLVDSLKCCVQGGISGRPLSVVCMTGVVGGAWSMENFEPMTMLAAGVALTRYSGGPEQMRQVPFPEIVKDVEAGRLQIPVSRTWKLEQIGEAHEVMEKGGANGKMVILLE